MKKRFTLTSALAALILLFTGAVVYTPAASAATTSGSSGGSSVTLTTIDSTTGSRDELHQDFMILEVKVPETYAYQQPGGTTHVQAAWKAETTITGDPSCASSSSSSRGRGDGVYTNNKTVWSYTKVGSCTVTTTVHVTRNVADHPAATVNEKITVSAPWNIKANTKVSAKVSKKPVKRGSALKVSGTMAAYVGYNNKTVSVSRQKVAIQQLTRGSKTWKTRKTVTTNKYGKYATSIKPVDNAKYRAVAVGTKKYFRSASKATAAINVVNPTKLTRPTVSVKSVKKRGVVSVRGKATVKTKSKYVAYKKAKVTIQAKTAGSSKWKTVKTVRANSKGAYTYKAKPTRTTQYRAIIKATSKNASVTSKVSKKVTVRR